MPKPNQQLATDPRPRYFIVKDGRHEYLVKREGDRQTLLTRTEHVPGRTTREQIFDIILTDLHVQVYEVTPGQMLEAAFGEPSWTWGKYEPVKQPEPLFPEPEPEPEEEPEPAPARRERANDARQTDGERPVPVCEIHRVRKYKDGVQGGVQKYRCPKCKKGDSAGSRPASAGDDHWAYGRAKMIENKLKKNPKCAKCGEYLRRRGSHTRKDGTVVTTYFCKVNDCSQGVPKPEEEDGAALLRYVTNHVKAVPGIDPQTRPDVAAALIEDYLEKKLAPEQLSDRATIKRYAQSQERLRGDRYKDRSLENPVTNRDDEKRTLKDTLAAPEPGEHSEDENLQ